ncbi:MAG: JAB domain-containing protein [Lachnospiraceae bacterium]|nr:JAB domain-containing protein [Lachnospiraceae bacterium]
MTENTLKKVSIRLVNDVPLVTERQLNKPEIVAEVAGDYIKDMDREVLCVINFNAKLQPINFNIVSIGTVNQSLAVPSDILKSAILSNANFMMVLHNHPSGDLTPSKDDIMTTNRLIDAGNIIGIPLLDHIIIGHNKDQIFSFRQKKVVEFKKSNDYSEKLEYINFKKADSKVAELSKEISR